MALGSVAAAVLAVFLTWTSDGPVELNGTQGPHNGWLVVILAMFALAWVRSMARGSWIGIVGVVACAVVMAWTGIESWLDSRSVLDASASYGLLVVVVASGALAGAAVASGVAVRSRTRATAAVRVRTSSFS